jgi:hypothetical protein
VPFLFLSSPRFRIGFGLAGRDIRIANNHIRASLPGSEWINVAALLYFPAAIIFGNHNVISGT